MNVRRLILIQRLFRFSMLPLYIMYSTLYCSKTQEEPGPTHRTVLYIIQEQYQNTIHHTVHTSYMLSCYCYVIQMLFLGRSQQSIVPIRDPILAPASLADTPLLTANNGHL